MRRRDVLALVARRKGLLLDISLGGAPQDRAMTMRDIGFDPRRAGAKPFPLPAACVNTAVVTHVLEYLPPSQFFAWWDALWRIMQPNGVAYISGPYGGDESVGWISDPEHRTRIIETTFAWLDPRTPVYEEHTRVGRRAPKPWHVLQVARVPGTLGTISYNVMVQKVAA